MADFECKVEGCEYSGSFRGVTNHAIAVHPEKEEMIRKSILFQELKSVVSDGVAPTFDEFSRETNISFQPIETLFGGYQEFVKQVGFSHHSFDRETIISGLQRISEEHLDGNRPTTFDVRELADFSPETVQYYFGDMNTAFEEAGFDDIHYMGVSKGRLIKEIYILEERLNSAPTARDMREYGIFSHHLYIDRFGSWNEAIKSAGFKPIPQHPEGEDNPMYGATGEDNPNFGNVGEDNPNYIHGSPGDPYSDYEYRRNRKTALERASHTCEHPHCSREESRHGVDLDCHHIIPLRMRENEPHSLDNLIILCREHHAEIEPSRWMRS